MGSVFDLNNQNSNLDNKITAGLERLTSVFRNLVWEDAKDLKLSPIQVQILIFINYHSAEYSTVSYLSKEFGVTKPTISDAVKSLELKGLIQKLTDANDSRSYAIQLTDLGKEYVSKSENYTNPLLQLIENIEEEEKKQLWNTLSNLIYQLHKKDVISVQRICFSCSYYSEKSSTRYCSLLNKELQTEEIRLDCPEHKIA